LNAPLRAGGGAPARTFPSRPTPRRSSTDIAHVRWVLSGLPHRASPQRPPPAKGVPPLKAPMHAACKNRDTHHTARPPHPSLEAFLCLTPEMAPASNPLGRPKARALWPPEAPPATHRAAVSKGTRLASGIPPWKAQGGGQPVQDFLPGAGDGFDQGGLGLLPAGQDWRRIGQGEAAGLALKAEHRRRRGQNEKGLLGATQKAFFEKLRFEEGYFP